MAGYDYGFGNQQGGTWNGQAQNFNTQSIGLSVTMVNGIESVMNYPVARNNAVFLVDFNAGKFWIKETDVNGIPKQIRQFDFKEIVEQPQNAIPSNAVSREEFNELKKLLEDLTAPSK